MEQERRIAIYSRKEFRKLVSLDLLRELRDGFEQAESEMPPADIVIDSEIDDPQTASRRIAAIFNLATLSTAI